METATARQCATRWSVSEATARKILAPLTPVGRDTETGAMLYDRAQADAAHVNRPGRGTRSDRAIAVLPEEDFERLASDQDIPVAHRALWALLRDGHARVSDALALKVDDIDFDRRSAPLDRPKLDSDPRAIPLSERTIELLRQAKGDREDGPLITGTHGRPLGRETASRFARQAGAASIHAFRPRPHRLDGPPHAE